MSACRVITTALAMICFTLPAFSQGPPWNGFASDAQHSAQSPTPIQSSYKIRWQTPVDLDPQYSSGELLIHYGSPLVTSSNTVIVSVKTGALGGFEIEAFDGTNGSLIWTLTTDYILPSHNWTPVFGPVLTSQPLLYLPGAGGTVYSRNSPDSANGTVQQIAFYGLGNYQAAPNTYNQNIVINTPLTPDSSGNIYFGFLATGATSANLQSGIARISSSGQGTWISASAAAQDSSITEVVYNCAPALSTDGKTLYIAVSNGTAGYLLAMDSTTLSPVSRMRLKDPKSGNDAWLDDDSSASPTVGPDGDVYFGVLEDPFPENHDRGWLLHFDSTLSQLKTPGAFGWDDTAAVVPVSMVASYSGTSSYLLMSKYNDYADAGVGGSGQNKIAVLDPNATETDPVTGVQVMKEVLTAVGLTPNPPLAGVKEWCINSAAVNPPTKTIIANNEDGKLYAWDLTANTFSQSVTLTSGLGEAYTPTVIGVDGTVYAINNATLFAVGIVAGSPDFTISSPQPITILSAGASSAPVPLVVTAVNNYSGTINFSPSACSISPAGSESSCSFAPASVTGSGTTQVTIQTTALQSAGEFPNETPFSFSKSMRCLMAFAFACLLCLALQSRQMTSRVRFAVFLALISMAGVSFQGCGGTGGETQDSGTPIGVTFTVTVSASAGTGQPSHSTSFTFIVQ